MPFPSSWREDARDGSIEKVVHKEFMGDMELSISLLIYLLAQAVFLRQNPFVSFVAFAHMGAVRKAAHIRNIGNGVAGVDQRVIGTDYPHHYQISGSTGTGLCGTGRTLGKAARL